MFFVVAKNYVNEKYFFNLEYFFYFLLLNIPLFTKRDRQFFSREYFHFSFEHCISSCEAIDRDNHLFNTKYFSRSDEL